MESNQTDSDCRLATATRHTEFSLVLGLTGFYCTLINAYTK
jgi:hypothetical protein